MRRAAAEIDPNAAICSSSSILPGPMRPSGSRLILRLSDGIVCPSLIRSTFFFQLQLLAD